MKIKKQDKIEIIFWKLEIIFCVSIHSIFKFNLEMSVSTCVSASVELI